MLKTTLAIDLAASVKVDDKEQDRKKIQVRIEMKKSQHSQQRKAIKVNKLQNPKSGSKWKN